MDLTTFDERGDVSFDPLTGLGLLTDAEFEALTPAEQLDYLNVAEKLVGSWAYTPRQLVAEQLAAEVDELLYGGAAGGGKSDWLLHHAYDLSLRIPGHVSLLLRRSFPELERSLIFRSILRFPPEDDGGPVFRKAERRWYFPNGSIIEFGHCDTNADVAKYLSAEYDFVGFDEGSQFTQWQITMVSSRCRVTRAKQLLGARAHIAIGTNPGGPSHGYIKRRYVKPTNHGEHVWFDEETERIIGFVQAKVADNPFLDPAYEKWLRALPDVERRQYLEGDWDVFAGQYFAEFDRSIHVIEPFPIPREWPRGRGADYGYADPFAVVWVAWDPDGRAYVYREFEKSKLVPELQAKTTLFMSGSEPVAISVAGPDAWALGHGVVTSVAERWARAGFHCQRAMNARVAGWSNVRSYLQVDPDGKPAVYFFKTCTRTIETLTELIFDQVHVEDAAKGDDHLPDGLRYILAARPRRARRHRKPAPATMQERLDASWEKMKRRAKRRRRATPQGVI
jgi:hypothetical protein